MTESRSNQGVFLRVLWEPADSRRLPEVYRQAETCLSHGRKPPGEVWYACDKHNHDWLTDHGQEHLLIPNDFYPASAAWAQALYAATQMYPAALWLGLDLLCVYSIRPRLFWAKMTEGSPVRFSYYDKTRDCKPYHKAVYCRSNSEAERLLELSHQCSIVNVLNSVSSDLDPDFDSHLPIIRHPNAVRPPSPAIFQEARHYWRMSTKAARANPIGARDTTIIIAARNQASFLGEAIQSAIDQTAPAKIVYVDDGSEDESVAVAGRFPVKVLRQGHQGVVAARNAGLAEAGSEYVLFLDGDDRLPPEYLAAKTATIENPGMDFVYSRAQCFGDRSHVCEAPDWSPASLWCRNYVNTSALFRRRDLIEVGGWRNTLEENDWDWDLALRLAVEGKVGVSERSVPLHYRKHADSLSRSRTSGEQAVEGYLLRNGFPTAIVTIYSGRLGWRFFVRWLEAVTDAVDHWNQTICKATTARPFAAVPPRPKLFVLATNGYDDLRNIPRGSAGAFDSVTLTLERWDIGPGEPNKVATHLARAYNRLVQSSDCPIVWAIEDDVLVPFNAMTDLNRALLWDPRYAVSGIYRNRHDPKFLIGGNWVDRTREPACIQHRDISKDTWVNLAGTGCLMWSRFLAPHAFAPWCGGLPAHDWNWSVRLGESSLDRPREKEVLLVNDVRCRHYQAEDMWV